jgi:hypothetical protein
MDPKKFQECKILKKRRKNCTKLEDIKLNFEYNLTFQDPDAGYSIARLSPTDKNFNDSIRKFLLVLDSHETLQVFENYDNFKPLHNVKLKFDNEYSDVVNINQMIINESFYNEIKTAFVDLIKKSVKLVDTEKERYDNLVERILDDISRQRIIFNGDFSVYFDQVIKSRLKDGVEMYRLVKKNNSLWNAVSICLIGNTCLSIAIRLLAAYEILRNLSKYKVILKDIVNIFNMEHNGDCFYIEPLANLMKRTFHLHFNNDKVTEYGSSRLPIRVFHDTCDDTFMAILVNLFCG